MPKVSIIIPVYNAEPYIRRCLDSVINQTLKDIEIIVINDCSADGSLKILKEYAKQDERVKLIDLPQNQGAAVARNKGLEIAKGEYLGFVDSDDAIELNFYEELYKKAKETNADIVKGNRVSMISSSSYIPNTLNKIIKNKSKWRFTYEWQSAIYKSSLIFDNKIIFPPEVIKSQDIVFLHRAVLKAKTVEIADNVNYYYFKREGSLSSKKIPMKSIKSALLATEYILKESNEAFGKELPESEYIPRYYSCLIDIINHTISQNDSIEAKHLCIKKYLALFFNCKNTKELGDCYDSKFQEILDYTKRKDEEKLFELFMKYENMESYFISKLKERVRKDMNNV